MEKTFVAKTTPKYGEVFILGRNIRLNYEKLYQDIDSDIKKGYFDKFPKVKRELNNILIKVNKLKFITNAPKLTNEELYVLKNNDYIKL